MEPMPKLSLNKITLLSSHPWIYFFLFLIVNSLLSYSPLSLEAKLWIGLGGLLLSIVWTLANLYSKAVPLNQDRKELLPVPTLWVWILLGVGVFFLRFHNLTTLSVWPHYDEGVYGYYAAQLVQQEDGRFFYGISRAPAFYVWVLGVLFRFLGPSLTTLWLLPAMVSLFCVPVAYWAARQFFSRSFSLVCTLGMAFGFWPLFLGRFSFMTGMVLLAECLAFFLLGKYLKASSLPEKKGWASVLGLLLGLGFFIHLHWPVIAALIGGILLYDSFRPGKPSKATLLFAALPFLLLFLPFAYFCFREGYGRFLLHLIDFRSQPSGTARWTVPLSSFSALFWGLDYRFHTYQPVWGGFLNPVLDSLFLLGVLNRWKWPKFLSQRWLLAALLFFLLPGLLTADCEPLRMVPVIPILLVFTAAGACNLLAQLSKRKAVVVGFLLLFCSGGLDAYHLFGAYHHLWDSRENWRGYAKSLERFRAYELLEPIRREKGPGLVFGDFVEGLPDETLTVATYGFNAVKNPRLSLKDCRWAAVLANVNFQPFLAKRFPDGKYAWLSRDSGSPDGGWMLWVMPVNPSRLEELKAWQKADQALGPCIDKAIGYFPGQNFTVSLEALQKAEPVFRRDPFLEACYWEKTADLHLKDEMFSGASFHTGSIAALVQALQNGYPAAHLYEKLGVLYLMDRNPASARKTFQKALRAPRNSTDAFRYLQSLTPTLK